MADFFRRIQAWLPLLFLITRLINIVFWNRVVYYDFTKWKSLRMFQFKNCMFTDSQASQSMSLLKMHRLLDVNEQFHTMKSPRQVSITFNRDENECKSRKKASGKSQAWKLTLLVSLKLIINWKLCNKATWDQEL